MTAQERLGGARSSLYSLSYTVFLTQLVYFLLQPILQLLVEGLGGGTIEVSSITTTYWAMTIFFGAIWGGISDITGRRKTVLAVTIVVSSAAVVVLALAGSIFSVLAVYATYAMFGAGVLPVALSIVSSMGTQEGRASRLSAIDISTALGFSGGLLLSGLLLESVDVAVSLVLAALISAVSLAGLLFLEDHGPDRQLSGGFALSRLVRELGSRLRSIFARGDILAREGLGYLYLGVTLRKAGVYGTYSLVFVYLARELAVEPRLMGLLTALNPVSAAILFYPFARLSDTFGRRTFFLLGLFLTIPTPLILATAESSLLLGAAFAINGIAFASYSPSTRAFVGDVAPDGRQGEFMGLIYTFEGVSGVFGPVLAGILAAPGVLGYEGMFLAMAGLIAVASVISTFRLGETLPE